MERTIVTEPYVPGSIGRAMRLHLWLGWLAVYLTCFWVGQAVMSLAPSDPGLAVVDCRGIIPDAGVTEARLQHAQITSEKTAAPAAIKMSPPKPCWVMERHRQPSCAG